MDKIDAWLIERYQTLVDITEKKPEWWVEQCAFGTLVTTILQFVLEPTHEGMAYVNLFLGVTVAAIFYYYSKMPAVLTSLAQSSWFRHFILAVCATGIFIDSIHLYAAHIDVLKFIVNSANNLLGISIYYFAACKPPRPREPRKKLVLSA